jgi:hypothetical protein
VSSNPGGTRHTREIGSPPPMVGRYTCATMSILAFVLHQHLRISWAPDHSCGTVLPRAAVGSTEARGRLLTQWKRFPSPVRYLPCRGVGVGETPPDPESVGRGIGQGITFWGLALMLSCGTVLPWAAVGSAEATGRANPLARRRARSRDYVFGPGAGRGIGRLVARARSVLPHPW